MQKFVGEAYLLNVNSYSKKEEGEKEERVYYRYEFLVGDQEDGSFLSNAHVEGYTADHPVIKGGGSFMEVIKVSVVLREFFVKGQGKVQKPVYEVLEQ